MAEKITGITVDYGQGEPLLDVDTAILDLLEDLGRAGRQRQIIALRQLIDVAKQALGPWHIYEGKVDSEAPLPIKLQREIRSYNYATRVIVLEPPDSEVTDMEP